MAKKFTVLLKTISALLLSTMALWSCTDEIKESPGGGEIIIDDDDENAVFAYPTYVGDIDPTVKDAVDKVFTNRVGSIAEASHVVLLGSINEVDALSLHQAYERGAIIAITNPLHNELAAFVDNNEWIERLYLEGTDDLLIYAFNNDDDYYSISLHSGQTTVVSDDIEDDEPEVDAALDPSDAFEDDELVEEANPHSHRIAGWVAMLNRHFSTMGLDGESPGDKDVASFFKQKSTPLVQYEVNAKHKIRKSGAYTDSCAGKASVNIRYDYSMVHVYDGEEGEGNYYIMQLVAIVNNTDMWNGKEKRKNHGGAVTKICGWLMNGFSVKTTLVDSLHNELKTIAFSPGTTPQPSSDIKTGSHKIGQNFSVNAGASISGGWDQKDGLNAGGKINVAVGWSWTDETDWQISERTVGRDLDGTRIGWHTTLDNFPTYTIVGKVSDLKKVNTLLKSDTELIGTWVWKETGTRDNTRQPPYVLKCEVNLEYFARSHVYSKTKDCYIKHDTTLYIPFPESIQTRTQGYITLNNNFSDITIYNIKVVNVDTKATVHNERNSYPPGSKVKLGQYSDTGNYTITFKTRTSGTENGKDYKYNLYETIPVKKGQVSTIYTNTDFAPIN